jgi:hypothetical protein
MSFQHDKVSRRAQLGGDAPAPPRTIALPPLPASWCLRRLLFMSLDRTCSCSQLAGQSGAAEATLGQRRRSAACAAAQPFPVCLAPPLPCSASSSTPTTWTAARRWPWGAASPRSWVSSRQRQPEAAAAPADQSGGPQLSACRSPLSAGRLQCVRSLLLQRARPPMPLRSRSASPMGSSWRRSQRCGGKHGGRGSRQLLTRAGSRGTKTGLPELAALALRTRPLAHPSATSAAALPHSPTHPVTAAAGYRL